MGKERTKILQIMPADGWRAHYKEENTDDILDRVVCFALVEVVEDGETWQEVRPMVGDERRVIFCQETSNFTSISHEKQEAN